MQFLQITLTQFCKIAKFCTPDWVPILSQKPWFFGAKAPGKTPIFRPKNEPKNDLPPKKNLNFPRKFWKTQQGKLILLFKQEAVLKFYFAFYIHFFPKAKIAPTTNDLTVKPAKKAPKGAFLAENSPIYQTGREFLKISDFRKNPF